MNTSLYASNTWSYRLKSEIGLNFQCQDLLMNNSTELIVPSCRMTHCLVDSPLREKGEGERERETDSRCSLVKTRRKMSIQREREQVEFPFIPPNRFTPPNPIFYN